MKKQILIGAGILALVLLVAGAAYIGGTLLNGQPLTAASGNGPMLTLGTGGNAPQQVKLDIEPAPELAELGTPLKRGIFVRKADNSIFVGTGQVKMMVNKNQSGEVSTGSDYDGPVVEVVVTHDTTIYKDVTMKQFNGPPPAGQKIQQVLEPGSVEEIGTDSMVQVWGTQNGDRAVANVLVYSPPAFFVKP